ncbi:MAG: HNH endonuclease, partial [Zoogloea sp.]|nr:HNH endonuclease [Zoogloea sp.]
GNTEEFDRILELIESYLIRRMICAMTTKNYNRYFIDLMRALDKKGAVTAANVTEYMAKSTADSTLFPDNRMFEKAATDFPLYNRLAQYKVRTILEALDTYALDPKSETIPLPSGLTIEHVMPQKWKDNWPISPIGYTDDPIKELDREIRRESLINTLGNLTLITGSLNPSLSNSDWATKRPELLKFSKLNLTQYFHGKDAEQWDEDAIQKRTSHLYLQMAEIWPYLPSTASSS